jgi:hypothetical protein
MPWIEIEDPNKEPRIRCFQGICFHCGCKSKLYRSYGVPPTLNVSGSNSPNHEDPFECVYALKQKTDKLGEDAKNAEWDPFKEEWVINKMSP